MRLSDNFTLEEFSVSASHPELVIPVPTGFIGNVRRLVTTILQPAREAYGKPFKILSGFRSAALNAKVGGSPTSQHVLAQAGDVAVTDPLKLFKGLMASSLPLGQVIYYPNKGFVHIATPGARYPRPAFFVSSSSKNYRQVWKPEQI